MDMTSPVYRHGLTRYEMTDIVETMTALRFGYAAYWRQFAQASAMNAQNTPMYIVLELNNYCNMRCKMCRKSMEETETHDNLDMELYEKILRDADSFGVPSLFFGGLTECTINPQIISMLRRSREYKRMEDVLITNGYKLTDELIDFLIDAQWEKLFVSLDAASDETYRKIRGRNLRRVEANLERLFEKKKQKRSLLPFVRVSFCVMPENRMEMEAFFQKWKDKVDIIDYQQLVDYSDMKVKANLPDTDRKCAEPFDRLMIDCHGEIYPCCVEWGRYMPLGNVRDISIEEAWNGEKMSQLRESIKSGRPCDICKSCMAPRNAK